jgi:hypothetical protein
MRLDITPSTYKAINEVMLTAQKVVLAKGIWLQFYHEYNIGHREGKYLKLNAQARIDIATLVKNQTGLNPRKDNYNDLKVKSRTEISTLSRDEKFISKPPRGDFVEVRTLDFDYSAPGYSGILVKDALELEAQCILSIENFDTFANIQRSDLSCLRPLATGMILVVFAGDSKASPKAVKELRSKSKLPWVHFGDYDPAGIHIALFRLKANFIMLPELAMVESQLIGKSNKLVYERQREQLSLIEGYNGGDDISIHISLIVKHHIAVMQESLIAHRITLCALQVG